MNRRSFLATGAALAVTLTGGCTGCARSPAASLSMTAVDDVEIAQRVTGETPSPGSDDYELLRATVENGTAAVGNHSTASGDESVTAERESRTAAAGATTTVNTSTTAGTASTTTADASATSRGTEARLRGREPVIYDGAVYNVSHEVVDAEPATGYSFTLNRAEGDVDESETVRYADLPDVDKAKLSHWGLDADGGFLGFGSSVVYTHAERAQSVLVPEPADPIIVWDSETKGRFTVESSYETEVKTYRYAAEQVNPSAEAYGRQVRERCEFTLSGLSSAERDVVEQAIGGENESGYVVSPDDAPPEAMRTLAERFRGEREVWGDESDGEGGERESVAGTYVVRYEGDVYWTSIYLPARTTTGTAA